MNTLKQEEIVARLHDLPALPTVVSELLASFGKDDADVDSLARQIGRDQALTARLLRVANSSFYGLQCQVATINDAVVVLGFRAVRGIVLAVGVSGVFKADNCPGFDAQGYMQHCVGVGLGARVLAQLAGRNPELAFTGGVLHDIGKLALASCFARQYARVLSYRERHDCPLVVAERDVLGLDHAVVGGLLADAWHFPPALRSAVAEHHSPSSATADSLADQVHVADSIAHALGLGNAAGGMVMPVDPTAWRRLDLDGEALARVLPQIMDGMDEACRVFSD